MFWTNENCNTVSEINKFKNAGEFSLVDFVSTASPGIPNEFYSEGDYWWPNLNSPDLRPYIRRDGLSNPEIFNAHRELLMGMSMQLAEYTKIYSDTGNKKYSGLAKNILARWFIERKTRMEPHLKYAQAIPGICTGREIGIIDTLHLVEVALATLRLKKLNIIVDIEFDLFMWFEKYLEWLMTHRFGSEEKKQPNNHAVCWYLQVAAFALFTGNQQVLEMCRNDYKQILLPNQMAPDGSFPNELARTKPYCYSIFNLEAMTALCQILTVPEDNLFEYETPDGLSLRRGMEFIYPYLLDKKSWPYVKDVMHWESWPSKQACLLFCGLAYNEKKYLDLWRNMPARKRDFEAIRNTPVKNPELWMNTNFKFVFHEVD